MKDGILGVSAMGARECALSLPVAAFRFVLWPRQPLFLPAWTKGNVLRGAFGIAFRHTVCVPECQEVRLCPKGTACPYRAIFEPAPPHGSSTLSKNQDIPRPFIFRAPLEPKTRYTPNEAFDFQLVLVGRGIQFLPYFLVAFRDVATEGLGLNRAPCVLRKVEQIGEVGSSLNMVYDCDDGLMRPFAPTALESVLLQSVARLAAVRRIRLKLLTPTFLRADGRVIREPRFHHILKRVRDRVNTLATFFGSGPLRADFRGLGERAEKVVTIETRFEWVELARTSSRTGQRHELSGVVGEATFEGDFREFLPWLVLAEWVHVGRHAAWGNGWLSVEQVP